MARLLVRVCLALFGVVALAPPGHAAIVNVVATGVIDSVPSTLSSAFAVGQAMSISLSFNDAVSGSGSATQVSYSGAILSITFSSPGYSASGTCCVIAIANDEVSGSLFRDYWEALASVLAGPSVGAFNLSGGWFYLLSTFANPAPTLLTSTALTQPAPVSDVSTGSFLLNFATTGNTQFASMFGHLTSAAVVPEPVSLTTCVLASFALFFAVRPRRAR